MRRAGRETEVTVSDTPIFLCWNGKKMELRFKADLFPGWERAAGETMSLRGRNSEHSGHVTGKTRLETFQIEPISKVVLPG